MNLCTKIIAKYSKNYISVVTVQLENELLHTYYTDNAANVKVLDHVLTVLNYSIIMVSRWHKVGTSVLCQKVTFSAKRCKH
jgi:hypothetical protein